jgi:hypothetical protein
VWYRAGPTVNMYKTALPVENVELFGATRPNPIT